VTRHSSISAIAALDDDLRRGMYEFIRRTDRPVTRDEAAEAVGISRKLAAFHLDKLVAAGLLVPGSADPGRRVVGRRPKTYRPSAADLQISIPRRRHGLLSQLLVAAVIGERDDESAQDAAIRVAREHGRRLGDDHRQHHRPGRGDAESALTLAVSVLEDNDFEPVRPSPTRVRLRNCPFHPLNQVSPDLVCGMNHALFAGVLAGLQTPAIEAVLDPGGGECCVELRTARDERLADQEHRGTGDRR
jgi:predicted ArsR family transcriptional regulator